MAGAGLVMRAAGMRADLQHLAEPARLEDLLHLVDRRRVAPAIADLEQSAGLFDRVDNACGIVRTAPGGLLAQHRLAGFERLDRPIRHQIAFGVDQDGMDVRIGEDILLGPRPETERLDEGFEQRTVVIGAHQADVDRTLERLHPTRCVRMGDTQAGYADLLRIAECVGHGFVSVSGFWGQSLTVRPVFTDSSAASASLSASRPSSTLVGSGVPSTNAVRNASSSAA